MRKSLISFFAGVVMTLLLVTLTTTALATSGKVTFGFANVALNGDTKIVSGENITVANGQKVPGSILYVDEAGGKTNYLPIRAISELLGVDIDYDSATKTVMLMTKTWQRTVDGKYIKYASINKDEVNLPMPLWRPNWIPDNVSLIELWHSRQENSVRRVYEGGNIRISYSCYNPNAGSFMHGMEFKESIQNYKHVTVQGNEADYYIDGDKRILVWENSEGMFFNIVARNLPEEDLFKIAESSMSSTETVDEHELDWLPSSYTFFDYYATNDTVNEQWVKDGVALTWIYSAYPIGKIQETAEEVQVNGEKAWYWDAELPFEDRGGTTTVNGEEVEGGTTSVGGATVTSVTVPGNKRMNTLVWHNSDTGTYFKLQSILDKDTMIRIADNVS